jgi:hypothetical protein
MSQLSRALGLDKNKELRRQLDALFHALLRPVLDAKKPDIEQWADAHGIPDAALEELMALLAKPLEDD